MNLAVNALEAMPNGGELVVTVERIAFRDGPGVQVSIRDTGVGMPPEIVARIWEPFYTTKPMGRGTGLGLATVHGTIHQAGGDVDVESTPGVGSTFRLRLPAAA
jgi:signal transduction histidine kinase